MGRLTDIQLRAWVRAGKSISGRSDGDGLTFTLSSAGVAAWVLRYRYGGRRREVSIGRYPDISLADARTKASELRAKVQGGEDVATLKQVEKIKAAAAADSTVEALARAWLERVIAPRVLYPGRVQRQLERYVFPLIGSLPVEAVTPMHVDQMELLGAQWPELDLAAGIWRLPGDRSKTKLPATIPLPPLAVSWLGELKIRAGRSPYVFPSRRLGARRLGHISPDTVNVSLMRVDHGLTPCFSSSVC
jgi:integrase